MKIIGVVLDVKLTEFVSEIQNNELFSVNEEIMSDARANDDMVGVKELEIFPHIKVEENDKIKEEDDEMDDLEE